MRPPLFILQFAETDAQIKVDQGLDRSHYSAWPEPNRPGSIERAEQ